MIVWLASFLLTEIVFFSRFLLNSRTVLHATNCISLGLISFTIAKSFFLITVFFLVFVSSVIVVGE